MQYNHILHIDDDADDQEIFRSALAYLPGPIQYTAFINAKEALAKLFAKEISTDLIFLDYNMPLMNGEQFLREIKKDELLKEIPVIVFSTSSQSKNHSNFEAVGRKRFCNKARQL